MIDRILPATRRLIPEGWQWWLLAAAGVAALWWVAPHQLPLLLWIVTEVAAGGIAGYWLDRALFPKARLDDLAGDAVEARHARYRRAGLIAAGALAVAVGM
jgi:hypothetical protein